jgi:hypothetical protein
MPDLDEDVLRQLLARSTSDLFASPSAAANAIKRQRRRQLRTRALGVVGTAAAAGLAAGIWVSGSGSSAATGDTRHLATGGWKSPTGPIRLTTAQRALYSLSDAAAKTQRPVGRYVVMKEIATTLQGGGNNEIGGKTNVIDTINGGGVTYQDITVPAGTQPVPTVLNAAPGTSPTIVQLDALPTETVALRAALLSQAQQQQSETQQGRGAGPSESNDDLVFDQAANLLWEPDLSPQLRSALYRVLAATPGVVVRTDTRDSSGRPATEISRFDPVADQNVETFENPVTGATLESAWADKSTPGFFEDLYETISYTNTIPADPYNH